MDIKNKTVLVLGAWGLVGNAVTRKIIAENPKKVVITSLNQNEILEEVEKLKKEFRKFDTLNSHIPRQPICLR